MGLEICNDCGATMSTTASKCLVCGAEEPGAFQEVCGCLCVLSFVIVFISVLLM